MKFLTSALYFMENYEMVSVPMQNGRERASFEVRNRESRSHAFQSELLGCVRYSLHGCPIWTYMAVVLQPTRGVCLTEMEANHCKACNPALHGILLEDDFESMEDVGTDHLTELFQDATCIRSGSSDFITALHFLSISKCVCNGYRKITMSVCAIRYPVVFIPFGL